MKTFTFEIAYCHHKEPNALCTFRTNIDAEGASQAWERLTSTTYMGNVVRVEIVEINHVRVGVFDNLRLHLL